MAHSLSRPARCLTAALAAALLWGQALAQLPFVPGAGKSADSTARPAAQAPGAERQAAELRGKLAAERQQLAILDAPGGLSAGAPPGTGEQALRLRHFRVAVIVRGLEQQLADLTKLAAVRQRRKTLE